MHGTGHMVGMTDSRWEHVRLATFHYWHFASRSFESRPCANSNSNRIGSDGKTKTEWGGHRPWSRVITMQTWLHCSMYAFNSFLDWPITKFHPQYASSSAPLVRVIQPSTSHHIQQPSWLGDARLCYYPCQQWTNPKRPAWYERNLCLESGRWLADKKAWHISMMLQTYISWWHQYHSHLGKWACIC